ncbi:MAG TPA: glycosyltransferase family 4 protein [Myxococcota bacterium]|nr:glycosyltransferase family 4 protein [Myxococcota bacterium]
MSGRRVLLVSPGWPRAAYANGIVSYVDNMKRGLEAAGSEVRVAAYATAPGGQEAALIEGAFARLGEPLRFATRAIWKLAPTVAARVLNPLDVWTAFRQLQRRWPFEVAEIEESRGESLWAARAVSAPVVVRLHGPWFLNAPARGVREDAAFRGLVAREGRAIARAEGLSSPSKDTLDRVRKRYGLALPNAVVIPNPGPEPDVRSIWSAASAEPGLILFVGRFDRHKGGDLVVDAFVKLASAGRSVRLVIAGRDDGVVDDAGRRWSFPEYLADRVPPEQRDSIELLGQVAPETLVELRKRASAVVFASRYENFPLSLLEALSQGCPLVSCDAGSCTEIVEDERNALLFPAGDAAALADRLGVLLDHPERAGALAARGLADYRSRFLPDQIALVTLDFYEDVLARRRVSSRET